MRQNQKVHCDEYGMLLCAYKKFEKYIDTVSASAYYIDNDTVSEYKANRRTET